MKEKVKSYNSVFKLLFMRKKSYEKVRKIGISLVIAGLLSFGIGFFFPTYFNQLFSLIMIIAGIVLNLLAD